MNTMLVLLLLAVSTVPPETSSRSSCPEEVQATATAYRLSELPQNIVDDLLLLTQNEIADSNAPLLQTDAPTAAERNHATVRFAQALLFRDMWLVQFEVTMFSDVRTVSYVRDSEGRFQRSPRHYFHGPACASIRAALSGVTTPRDF